MSHMTLKQFMLRSEVLKLFRGLMRVAYKIEDVDQRKSLQEWIRADFESNKHHKDEFMLRSEVLKLFRGLMRVAYKIEDVDQRKSLQEWIRADFESNKHHKDEEVIRMMISKGKLSLHELEQIVMLAK